MKFALIVLALSGSMQLSAQDTTYYNESWGKSTRADAAYYRIGLQNGEMFDVKDHYIDGSVQMTGTFKDPDYKVKHGYFTYYEEDGLISMEGNYRNDKQEDLWKWYFANGDLESAFNYKDGELNGDLKTYHANGKLKREEIYNAGDFVKGTCYSEKGRKIKFFPYEEPAVYKGGKKAMIAFLSSNMKYPDEAVSNHISGKVWLRFVVNTDGKITDIKVIKGVHPLLDMAALEIVRKMPEWIPGKIDGQPVKSYFDLPVNFNLD